MRILALLENERKMALLEDLVTTGASIGTTEAKLCLPQGTLAKWLALGEKKPRSPYRTLYMKYRSFAAEARAAAEAQQLAKTPSQWLERNTSARVVEPKESQDLPGLLPQSSANNLQVGANALLAALRTLQESGVNIDEAIRKNQVQVALPSPEFK